MSIPCSKKFFQLKYKLIKEIYNLKQFIQNNIICFECEMKILSPADKVKKAFIEDIV